MADITPPMPAPAAPAASTTPHKNRSIFWILLVIVILLIAAGAYYFLVYKTANDLSLYVSANTDTPSQLYKVNTVTKTFTPVTASGEDKGSFVIDAVTNATTTYYLISDESGTTSNIYKSVNGAPVTQISNSPTLKYDLSYDPSTNYFAYLSAKVLNPAGFGLDLKNSLFDAITATPDANGKITTENILATSTSGVLIVPETDAAVVDTASGLYMHSLTGSQSLEIFPSNTPMIFGVSQYGTLAFLNPYTNAIDAYTLNGGISHVSYYFSRKPQFAPTAISFDGTALIYAGLGGARGDFYSRFFIPGPKNTFTTVQVTNPEPIQAASPLKISYE